MRAVAVPGTEQRVYELRMSYMRYSTEASDRVEDQYEAFTWPLSRDCTTGARDNARSSRWTNSAESKLTALRHVKALV
jgi:hypothetical protein